MKITRKILTTFIIIAYIVIILTKPTFALGSIIKGGDEFENARFNYTVNGIHSNMEIKEDDLKNVSNTVYNILLLLGIVIAVIYGMILGMKFMTGGIEEQAKVKESIIPYIVGCAVVFGAFTIWKVVLEVLKTTT